MGQRCIVTPMISPELNFRPFAHFKLEIIPAPASLLQNLLPNRQKNTQRDGILNLFPFFPTKGPFQLNTTSLTVSGNTHGTAIRELSPPFLKPIQGENLPPSGLPSKKSSFGWNLIHPNVLLRESEVIGSDQQNISILNPKNTTSPPFQKTKSSSDDIPYSPSTNSATLLSNPTPNH